jgi:hypothetical protein
MDSVGSIFLSTAIRRMKYYKDLGEKSFAQLTGEQMHFSSNENSNSIAVIVRHMAGNMLSRWTNFLTEDGEKEWRDRDAEFETHEMNKEAVIVLWEKGWKCFFDTVSALKEDDLLKTIHIRHEPLIVIDAIIRQMAHYPYHVGQIIYIAKMLKNDEWQSLTIPKGGSVQYNAGKMNKDPAKKF